MENENIKKTVRSNYDFVNKAQTYYQGNKEKIPKRLRECYRNLSKDEKI